MRLTRARREEYSETGLNFPLATVGALYSSDYLAPDARLQIEDVRLYFNEKSRQPLVLTRMAALAPERLSEIGTIACDEQKQGVEAFCDELRSAAGLKSADYPPRNLTELLGGLSMLQKVRECTTCLMLLRTVVHARMPSTQIVSRGTTVADHTHRHRRSQRMRTLPPQCRGRQAGRRQV